MALSVEEVGLLLNEKSITGNAKEEGDDIKITLETEMIIPAELNSREFIISTLQNHLIRIKSYLNILIDNLNEG